MGGRMRRVWTVATIVLAGVVGACERGEDDALSEADIAAIQRIGQEHTAATLAGDWDRLLASRTEGIVWMPPNAPPVEGKEALRRFLEANPRAVRFEIRSSGLQGNGDVAYDRGTYVFGAVMGRDTVTETGKYLVVFRREGEDAGGWRAAIEMWSANAPPAVAAAGRRRS